MLEENDSKTYNKILFPLFFGLGGGMLTYTLSGMIKAIPLIMFFILLSLGSFLYALWNIWQLVSEKYRPKIYGAIALFTVLFHGTTITVNSYFQGIIASIYGYILMHFFWKWLTKDQSQNTFN